MPRPLPAFYSGKSTAGFRKWLPADEIDANVSLGGSFCSENIEDYHFSPYDVGYGKIVKFDHDFVGRKALEGQVASGQTTAHRKVTLQWNGDDVAKAWASMYQPGVGAKFINLPIAHYATYHYDRVEAPDGSFRGRSLHTGYSANYRSMLSIAVVDTAVAEPGTELVVVWGEPKPSSKAQVENHVQVLTLSAAPASPRTEGSTASNPTSSRSRSAGGTIPTIRQ